MMNDHLIQLPSQKLPLSEWNSGSFRDGSGQVNREVRCGR